MAQDEFKGSHAIEEALPYIESAMYSMCHMLGDNYHLCTLNDEELSVWEDGTKCQLETGQLSLVFRVDPFGGDEGALSDTSRTSHY